MQDPVETNVGRDSFPVAVSGKGQPLLFLHGAPGDQRTWSFHQQTLSGDFLCISITQRWFGTAAWREDGPPFGTHTHAADLVAIVRALDLAPVRVVAWSYSAHVLFKALLDEPDLFHSALVYEPGFPTFVEDGALLRSYWADSEAMFAPVEKEVLAGRPAQAVRMLIDACGGPGYFDRQSEQLRRIHLDSAPMMPLLMGNGAQPASITSADLRAITTPLTITWGSATRAVFAIPSRTAAVLIQGEHEEVAGEGHLWPEQDPPGFCKLIRRRLP